MEEGRVYILMELEGIVSMLSDMFKNHEIFLRNKEGIEIAHTWLAPVLNGSAIDEYWADTTRQSAVSIKLHYRGKIVMIAIEHASSIARRFYFEDEGERYTLAYSVQQKN